MEKNEIVWKKAEQSFVSAYDFANEVLDGKCELSSEEEKRLLELLTLWLSALENMAEHASDVEMARDFQSYQSKLKVVIQCLKDKFYNNL